MPKKGSIFDVRFFFVEISLLILPLFNPQQLKVFGVKFSLGEIEKIFSLKYAIYKLSKMSK